MVSQGSSIFCSYFKEFILDLYCMLQFSTLSSSSESAFHAIHYGYGAFHCVFNLIYWIFISSTLSVWLFFSYSLCGILFSFLVLTSLFHLLFFFYWIVLTSSLNCLDRVKITLWILWMFFPVILTEAHYYGIGNFWRSIVLDFCVVLFLHWNLHIWTWLSDGAAQRPSVCDRLPAGAGSEQVLAVSGLGTP